MEEKKESLKLGNVKNNSDGSNNEVSNSSNNEANNKESVKIFKNTISAFDPSGINKSAYRISNSDYFDASMLKSYSRQIAEISNKAFRLYKKKMRIKDRISDLRRQLKFGQITQEDFEFHYSKVLKGHEEYKVYEMYDEYISYLISHMKSYSEGIFSYIDSHKFEIPIISKTDEEKKIEQDYLKSIKETSKSGAAKIKEEQEGWTSKVDEFAEKRVKKNSIMDNIANSINKVLFPSKDRSRILAMEKGQENASRFSSFLNWFLGKKDVTSALGEKQKNKQSALDKFIEDRRRAESVVGSKTAFSERFKNVRRIHFEADDEFSYRDEKATKDDIKNFVDKLGKKSKVEISYKPTTYSSLANIIMKDYSIEIVNSFPDFFKKLYKNIRYANIHTLSSTYTNTMLLTSIIAGISSMLLVGMISMVALLPLPIVLANFFLGGILGVALTILIFSSNPKYIMKTRERNINTNLPFAIDHMAAVASSGVSPANMFQLISQSKDYGEVSVEVEKIVEYIELFGYDIMSAMRKVSATCPSLQMREFFEGFVSNAESGGELKTFLREFADQSMLTYRLERQKYTDSISTFSDIYTGLMVASPLFFVATLSMVSILGGTVGGMDVNTMMVLGTYVFIPLLNVVFILFMEMTQPNI